MIHKQLLSVIFIVALVALGAMTTVADQACTDDTAGAIAWVNHVIIDTPPCPSVDALDASISALTGDIDRGQALFWGSTPDPNGNILGCISCHGGRGSAPAVHVMYEYAQTAVEHDPQHTVDSFLVESIVDPSAFVEVGYVDMMPSNYSDRLSDQDIADLVAYIQSFQP